MKYIQHINNIFVLVVALFLVSVCISKDENVSYCDDEEYDPNTQICCGNKIADLIDRDKECKQSISVLLPTLSGKENETYAEGIARFQELPNNTLEIFILAKNLDSEKEYYTVLTEYGDTSTPNGTAMGDPLQLDCSNGKECNKTGSVGNLGGMKFINEYTSATGFIKEDLSIKGEQSILGKGILVYTIVGNNTEEVVLQGSIALCGKWCVDQYPINEALINHANWTWYIPHLNTTIS